jgi:hypothetical protein
MPLVIVDLSIVFTLARLNIIFDDWYNVPYFPDILDEVFSVPCEMTDDLLLAV